MIFLHQNVVAVILVALTILVQSAGLAALIHWIKAQFPHGIHRLGLFRSFVLVVRFTSLLVCLHMLEILLWALFYRVRCISTWEGAFYFSAANYSTVGAGDLLLKQIWRAMGPVESLTGMLMCGFSASFLFAVVTRLIAMEDPSLADPGVGATAWANDRGGEKAVRIRPRAGDIRDAGKATGQHAISSSHRPRT